MGVNRELGVRSRNYMIVLNRPKFYRLNMLVDGIYELIADPLDQTEMEIIENYQEGDSRFQPVSMVSAGLMGLEMDIMEIVDQINTSKNNAGKTIRDE